MIILNLASNNSMFFQDFGNILYKNGVTFHNYIGFYLSIIITLVFCILFKIIDKDQNKPFANTKILHNSLLEIIWTLLPSLILILISLTSFKFLYSLDRLENSSLTIKVLGFQWAWSYEFSDFISDFNSIQFDSYIISKSDLSTGEFSSLEVDNRILLPVMVPIRVLVTSKDVIHCFALPSLNCKIDAVPGRLNQTLIFLERGGLYFGQCSEICGEGHSQMPIVVEGVKESNFFIWLYNLFLDNE